VFSLVSGAGVLRPHRGPAVVFIYLSSLT